MSVTSKQMLVKFHVLALFICITLKHYPYEYDSSGDYLTLQCEYDSRELCPLCFSAPNDCDFFRDRITIETVHPLHQLTCRFNHHEVSYGLLDKTQKVVIKNLNKHGMVEEMRNSLCDELMIDPQECQLSNGDAFLQALRMRALDMNLVEGCIFCPSRDERTLLRFLEMFDGTELLKLILMRANVQPMLLKLFSMYDLPVPEFIYQAGFTLVESYGGDTLVNYYNSPLNTRFRIANELINASLRLTDGIEHFRFYLTDINPDNIAVQVLSNEEIKVSFIDIDNVIILDSSSKHLDRNKQKAVHARIECDGCFAYVQDELCSYHHSDINFYSICQLFLENLYGNSDAGFLHTLHDCPELNNLNQLLNHCVYCRPPDCQDRRLLLQQVQDIIQIVQSQYLF